jgi:hypothetical protein
MKTLRRFDRKSSQADERRACPRLRLPAMLTSVIARLQPRPRERPRPGLRTNPRDGAATPTTPELHGHAYDISETGVRIELDEALPLGSRVNVSVNLPWAGPQVHANAKVVWVNDAEDDPGPRRMALQFHRPAGRIVSQGLAEFIDRGLCRQAA